MSTLAGVVFDLDGTLVDTESIAHHVLTTSLAALGHEITEEEIHGLRGKAWSHTGPWMRERFGVAEEGYRAQSSSAWDAAFEAGVDTFDDTVGVLGELRAEGVPVAVCTSSGRGHLDRVLAAVPALSDAFVASVSATEVTNHKPDPEPYRRAVELLGTPPDRTVAIEDTATGVAAARGAGLRVIGRPSGPPTDLSAAHLVVEAVTRAALDQVVRRVRGH